jgi:FixJ family two-component response regulator
MEALPRTVFIVDDEPEVCRALDRLLRSASYATRTFGCASEFLESPELERPGCVLLDYDLASPGMNGLTVQAKLVASGCPRPIIFLSGRADIETSVAALRGGAVDFLTKPFDERELFRAVGEALAIDAAHRRMGRMLGGIEQRLNTLTARERQVLEHVARGRLNKQIAADLGTVEKTVKVHRSRVMRKMGARSLAELVQLASAAGVVPAFGQEELPPFTTVRVTLAERSGSVSERGGALNERAGTLNERAGTLTERPSGLNERAGIARERAGTGGCSTLASRLRRNDVAGGTVLPAPLPRVRPKAN